MLKIINGMVWPGLAHTWTTFLHAKSGNLPRNIRENQKLKNAQTYEKTKNNIFFLKSIGKQIFLFFLWKSQQLSKTCKKNENTFKNNKTKSNNIKLHQKHEKRTNTAETWAKQAKTSKNMQKILKHTENCQKTKNKCKNQRKSWKITKHIQNHKICSKNWKINVYGANS